MKKNPNADHLPALLNKYAESDYMLQQRAKFIYYLCILLACTALFLIAFRLLSGFISPGFSKSLKIVVLPLTAHVLVIILCLWLLRRGYYDITANLLPLLIIVTTWLIMFFEDQTPLIKLDSVVYILATLSMLPLLFARRKSMILVYTAINIFILVVFMLYYKSPSGITRTEMWDYLVDVSVTMALIGIVGYNIYNINKKALDKAESDIKKRTEAEAALLKSEKKFREMTELLPQTLYESDLQGKLTYINRAGTEMFGYSADEVHLGLNVFTTIASEDHKRLRENIANIIAGLSTHGNQYTALRKDGTTFPIQIYSSVIREENVPVGFRGVIYDVTDIIRAQEELVKSNDLFKTLIESIPIAITLSDLEDNLILANKTFCRETSLTADEILGKKLWDFGFKGNAIKEQQVKELLLEKGSVEGFEIDTLTSDNVRHELYIYASLVEVNNQKVILRSNVNVTELKQLQRQLSEYNQRLEELVKERTMELATTMEQLKAANEELQSTNEELYTQREQLEMALQQLRDTQEQLIHTEKMASLGILTAGVAHEINNPINYIHNGSIAIENYIHENIPEHHENLKPLFDAINTGVTRTANIVKSLSSYSRKEKVVFHKCQVHQVLENSLTMLFNQYKNRIRIIREFDDHMPEILANESSLHQVFLNILTNAVQAIETDGMITIKTKADKKTISVSISDNGIGIKEEDLTHIFDPFFTTKDPGKGTGLGLSIVQRIIKEHNGSINCKSRLNHGTEFIVNLPVNQPA
ncbi:MAG: PAS domain S-box protein [Bacteroidales bacterium]